MLSEFELSPTLQMKINVFTIFILQGLSSMTMSVTLVGDPLAIEGQNYKLTCNRTNISPSVQMDWYKDGIQFVVTCAPLAGLCEPSQLRRYNFITDRNGMYIHITGLRRSEDQGQWKCTYKEEGTPLEISTMNLTIFTIPNGLTYTQEPTSSSDLSLSAVTLQCVTSSCIYPVPVINWYYKDLSPPSLATLYKTTGTQTAEANCTSPENISRSRLELLQNTTWSDNINKTVTFSCGIEYPRPLGTVYSKDSFTITFAIRVSWVQMRQNSTTLANTTLVVTSGDPITLNCVTGTSRPDPTIEWFIGNESKCSGANFTFIPADTDHDKTIYCRAYNTNPNITVESAKPTMFVRVRVTNVTLEANDNAVLNGTLTVTSEQPTTLTCVTGTSRPPAVIEWYFRSQMMGNESNLTFTPANKDHGTDIYCQAYNIDPSKPVISIKQRLFVKVNVSNVTFWDSSGGTMVFYEGYPKTLKCISSPSRPVSSITWWFESQSGTIQLTNNVTNTEEPVIDGLQTRISEITLTLMKDSRNKKIFCNGTIDGQQPSAVSTKVNVDVWFQPQKPKVMEVNEIFPWLVSRTGTLHCHSSDYGNPNSSIKWTSDRGIEDSKGRLVYQELVPDDNEKVVSCKLINNYTITMNTSIISESVRLNVEYSPIIRMNMTDFLTVNETQSVRVLCTASGNPSPNQTVWRGNYADNILTFVNISRTDTSNYTCESTATSRTHGTLTSQKTIAITVQYAPDVNVTTTGQAQENMSSSIRCEVKGVPALYTLHPWKHMWGDVLIRDNLQQNSIGSNDNILRLERMTVQDTGTYICSADNGIKGINGVVIQKGTVDINVIAIPVIIREDNNLITEEVGHSVNISIPFYSYPAINYFVFMKNGTEVENTSRTSMQLSTVTVNYTSYSKTVKLEAQAAQLYIQNLTLHDFDNYTLLLKNSFGPKSFTMKLDLAVYKPSVDKPEEHDGPSVVAIAGGIVAAVVVIAIVTAVIIFIRKRSYSRSRPSGLIDNPVYASSVNLSSPSLSSNDVERERTVDLKAKHPTVAKVDDPKSLYAQVDKKKHKANKKGETKGKLRKVPREDTYENATLGKRSTKKENMDKNVENDMDSPSENVYENPGIVAAKDKVTNKDDLHYADLMLGPPKTKAGKPVIHGLENRTEYAEIAYGIRGEPLPESDDEQEKAKKK